MMKMINNKSGDVEQNIMLNRGEVKSDNEVIINDVINRIDDKGDDKNSQSKDENHMSYAKVVGAGVVNCKGFSFKNMMFKDDRSDSYIKKGIWWFRQPGTTIDDYLNYFTEIFGKGCIEMIYQVAYKRIEAFARNETMAINMVENEVKIKGKITKIKLMNVGPQKICIKNIMPWISSDEIVQALLPFGDVLVETIKYLHMENNIEKTGYVSSATIVLYINRKTDKILPDFYAPKILNDYYRWYLAPMSVKCHNCEEMGHRVKFCGRDIDNDRIQRNIENMRNKNRNEDGGVQGQEDDGKLKDPQQCEDSVVEGHGEEEGMQCKDEINEINKENGENLIDEQEKESSILKEEENEQFKLVSLDEKAGDMMKQIEGIIKNDLEMTINGVNEICGEEEDVKRMIKTKRKRKNISQDSDGEVGKQRCVVGSEDSLGDLELDESAGIFMSDEERENEMLYGRRLISDMVDEVELINEAFESSDMNKCVNGKMDERGYNNDGDKDKVNMKELIDILMEAASKRRKKKKAYNDKELERYTIYQLERLVIDDIQILRENGMEIEFKNYKAAIKRVRKNKKESMSINRVSNDKSSVALRIREKELMRDELENQEKGEANYLRKRIIPPCGWQLTQLIKTVDQADEQLGEDVAYQVEFFQYLELDKFMELLNRDETLEFLNQNERLLSVKNFMVQALEYYKRNAMSGELTGKIEKLLEKKKN